MQPVAAALPGDFGERFAGYPHNPVVIVDVASQQLQLLQDGKVLHQYPVSTAVKGVGSQVDSFKTPLGWHRVRQRIGAGAPSGTIIRARVNTGEIADIETRPIRTGKDYVTSRILWLDGLEEGRNRGDGVDSFARFIYIHGTHEEGLIGKPASQGCIRMTNADVIELFELLPENALVWIRESADAAGSPTPIKVNPVKPLEREAVAPEQLPADGLPPFLINPKTTNSDKDR